ncbi:hypothetical protein O181_122720 [Austropuccinia psidii MF-1]|uniref:Uncharacterized protein n=1 Tax=Austropuccinia psidii MF-1 TaxID=1389203 RepID=A0A9Q3KJW4_9BASI|nr:hypothetical protein [Austropuccinia psidii MF-1]
MRPRAQHVDQWTTLIDQSGPAGRKKATSFFFLDLSSMSFHFFICFFNRYFATSTTALFVKSAVPRMKTIHAPMLNTPPILVSNQHHPLLLLCHIATYLLTLIVIHHLYPEGEIQGYIPLMPYLDVETQGRLVGMCQATLSFRSIAEWNNLPLTTVYNTKELAPLQLNKKEADQQNSLSVTGNNSDVLLIDVNNLPLLKLHL